MAQPSSKKLVLAFVLLVLLTSWSYEAFIIFGGGVARFGLAGLVILMWIPGLLSILLRLALGLGFGDVRFIVGRPRYYGYALLLPLALALITGLLCVILDIRQFALIESHDRRLHGAARTLRSANPRSQPDGGSNIAVRARWPTAAPLLGSPTLT